MADEKERIEIEYVIPSAGLVSVERIVDQVLLDFAGFPDTTKGVQVVLHVASTERMLEAFESIAHQLRQQLRPASSAH